LSIAAAPTTETKPAPAATPPVEKIEIRLNGREIESARPESRRGQVRD
jgi:hypothetical protein